MSAALALRRALRIVSRVLLRWVFWLPTSSKQAVAFRGEHSHHSLKSNRKRPALTVLPPSVLCL